MTVRAPLSLLPLFALLATSLGPAAPAAALEIFYEVEEDIGPPGEDPFWIYTYRLAGADFQAGEGFAVLFHPDEFGDLVGFSGSPDWDAVAIAPDPLLPDFGLFDALALVDAPDTSVLFRVPVQYTGEGTPAEQPWIRYGTDFEVLESGTTVPLGVPEPGVALLMLTSAGLLVLRRAA